MASADSFQDRSKASPKGVRVLTVTAVVAVLVLNLGILAYAVHRGGGVETAAVREVAAPVREDPPPEAPAPAPEPEVPRAERAPGVVNPVRLPPREFTAALYAQHCAACHGPEGRGDGPAADRVHPAPRDLVEEPYRFVTASRQGVDFEESLRRVIEEGIPHSSMVGFRGVLSDKEIAGLVSYVADMQADPWDEEPMDLGRRPPVTSGTIARGANLYDTLGCTSCHGPGGRGDGPDAATLLDSLERPVRPSDFSTGVFKSGPDPEDLAGTIMRGVPGTPMTGYAQALEGANPDGSRNLSDTWALVDFIRQLPSAASRGEGAIPSGASIAVASAPDEEMVADPGHVAWLGVEPVPVRLYPIWERGEKPVRLSLRAVRTDERVAIALEWKDATRDVRKGPNVFPDAASVMFSLSGEIPPIPMAVPMEGAPEVPVNLWHWQAHRQAAASAQVQPVMALNAEQARSWYRYMASDAEEVRSGEGGEEEGEPRLPSFATAGDVGNPLAERMLANRPVLESNALGFGTLTLQQADRQGVQGSAVWSGGVWRVVMSRTIETGEEGDVDFTRSRVPVAFGVWDGSKGDRDGVKLITGWHWLTMERGASPAAGAEAQTASAGGTNVTTGSTP